MDNLVYHYYEHKATNLKYHYNQQQKLFVILDDFQWSEYYHDAFQALAEFWNTHPEEYQIVLNYGARIIRLDHLSEDDPEIEHLAREGAVTILRLFVTILLCV
ncbi:MAG: hypothetical protein PHZ03_06000 [Syntrophomonas sp.]|nr:hypothetical protein [Syntrophomonas sp.]